jgi:hypothetical protein
MVQRNLWTTPNMNFVISVPQNLFPFFFPFQFHILFILADGQMEDADPTLEALVDASNFPLSIVMIGVGDGPWGLMEDCDDLLPSRKFDNFQVNFKKPDSTSIHWV